jgi:DNA-binding transcriptional ArsR family regulator
LTSSIFITIFPIIILDLDTDDSLLTQLGNQTILKIVRDLLRAGESGMAVGEIQKNLEIPHSTLSHHINHLRSVGLLIQKRESTVLRCFVNFEKIDNIVKFLTEECCVAERNK